MSSQNFRLWDIPWVWPFSTPLMKGGLISRYVVGLLYARGLFETIQPVNFTTFATPHLGIRHINPGVFHNLANRLGARLLGFSGRHMFIADHMLRPLLLQMAEKGTFFGISN